MAIVKYEKNGQGYFDFTELLAVTCEGFIKELNWQTDFLTNLCSRINEKFEVIVEIEQDMIPTVYFKRYDTLVIYKWYSIGRWEKSRIVRSDLEKIVRLFE